MGTNGKVPINTISNIRGLNQNSQILRGKNKIILKLKRVIYNLLY